ncbi:MAG TPA: hypothetical protein VHW09_30110 [Bryobacteraceae bacterium]|jgi:hypothetical protein|nr:hypothetical protein [Bryobacteraceae bacterium]
MVEACPVCDTLWRLYSQAADNLHELNAKHRDARGKGDQNTVEILAHEIVIAESALPVVRRQLRRHETSRHVDAQGDQKQQKEKGEKEKNGART